MTRHATADERADHDRDLRKHDPRPSFDQRAAVAKLVGIAEGLAGSGLLGDFEPKVRAAIAETLVAFDMPSRRESTDA
jgi:hypothetical protein